jgi:sugar lactone lactonase YvrE
MKTVHVLVFALLAAAFLLVSGAVAQQTVPQIPFHADAEFLKLPDDIHLGEAAGVAVNSKGHIFVFSRGSTNGPAFGAAAAQVLEFDQNGKYVREIGKGLYAWAYAHTVRVDKNDNLWAIDKGSDMVIRFNPQGRVNMVFGRKKEASDEAEPWTRVNPPRPPIDGQFRQPTDVTWDPQGNIYISDGYINSRVAKYDANGDWVKSFGEPGNQSGQLNTPHSIAADAQGNIYVADRGNRRIQVFNSDGQVQRQITIDVPIPPDAKPWFGAAPTASAAQTQNGAPWAICITPPNAQGQQFLFSSDAFPGRIYKLSLDGKVLGQFGKSGRQPGQLGWIHEMACPSENELFVAEILNWRVQHLTLPKK